MNPGRPVLFVLEVRERRPGRMGDRKLQRVKVNLSEWRDPDAKADAAPLWGHEEWLEQHGYRRVLFIRTEEAVYHEWWGDIRVFPPENGVYGLPDIESLTKVSVEYRARLKRA